MFWLEGTFKIILFQDPARAGFPSTWLRLEDKIYELLLWVLQVDEIYTFYIKLFKILI